MTPDGGPEDKEFQGSKRASCKQRSKSLVQTQKLRPRHGGVAGMHTGPSLSCGRSSCRLFGHPALPPGLLLLLGGKTDCGWAAARW